MRSWCSLQTSSSLCNPTNTSGTATQSSAQTLQNDEREISIMKLKIFFTVAHFALQSIYFMVTKQSNHTVIQKSRPCVHKVEPSMKKRWWAVTLKHGVTIVTGDWVCGRHLLCNFQRKEYQGFCYLDKDLLCTPVNFWIFFLLFYLQCQLGVTFQVSLTEKLSLEDLINSFKAKQSKLSSLS